jgi:hypothetical protein
MPLDETGKQYAAMLYQKRLEEILASQSQELQKVTADFGKRNMLLSGMYLSARANVIGRHAGHMAEAMAQTLSQAYERAGQPLNETTLQEITTEVSQFSEGYKTHLRAAANNLVQPHFSGQAGLVEALRGEMEGALAGATSRVTRDLNIKHYEIRLDQKKAAMKGYAAGMGKEWDVFISHASEDKESFVRPLARALERTGLRVWYDATALTVGDSLRGKIDEGLLHSRYGIVVLSTNFFVKPWPQRELDGLVSREVSGIKVILPIWHDIDFEQVRMYSPMLAGLFAARSSDGMEKVVRDLRAAMGLGPD